VFVLESSYGFSVGQSVSEMLFLKLLPECSRLFNETCYKYTQGGLNMPKGLCVRPDLDVLKL